MYKVSGCVCKKPSKNGYYLSLWWFEGKERFRKTITPSPLPIKKSDAQQALKKQILLLESELNKRAGRHDLLSILESIELSSLFKVRPNTLYKYECIMNKYIRAFKQIDKTFYLEDITSNDFQLLFQYFAEYHNHTKPTIKTDKAFLHKLFDKLIIRYSLTRNNPISLVDLNEIQFKEETQQFKRIYMTDDEIVSFYQFLLSNDHYRHLAPIFKLCITIGIRRSECLGLLWENIDFSTNTIYIKHTRIKGYKGQIIDTDAVKTKNSYRSFPISESINKTLQSLNPQSSGHVFTDSNNKPYYPDYISKDFKKALIEFGLPEYMSFKTTRSTCACRMIEQHFNDSEIILIMGHSNPDITRRHYLESTMRMKKEMLEKTSIHWD